MEHTPALEEVHGMTTFWLYGCEELEGAQSAASHPNRSSMDQLDEVRGHGEECKSSHPSG